MPAQSRKTSAVQDNLRQGRESYRRRAWGDVYRSLLLADQKAPLEVEDLELLATATYLVGRDLEFCRILDRAYQAHLEVGDPPGAARCAFWSGLILLFRGEAGQAGAWLARAHRLVDSLDCVEQGYLLLPVAERQLDEGHEDAAHASAQRAAEIGNRFADAELTACARHLLGRARLRKGHLPEGLALLDEAMLAAVEGKLSPIMTGLIYCSVLEACHQVFALHRAREWTTALSRWCDQQKEMVAFTGTCLVRRAEIMQIQGAWSDAKVEVNRACEPISNGGVDRAPPAAAFYQKAEMHRLCGEVEAAEEAYRSASRLGLEPQPGLALLRMSQGRTDAASATIRRVVSAALDPLQRARLLPAHIEIMLASGDIQEARDASRDLEGIAEKFDTDILQAMAAQACGAIALAEGQPGAALTPLRRAFEVWQEAGAAHEAARVRVLMGMACRSLGDEEAGELEIAAARAVFERLGAAPEIARLDALGNAAPSKPQHELTQRELQILLLIASGKTNKAIAGELFLSERTIDRHVSNILCKLDVPSRAAAIAYAYQHKLI
jgi:DNA-binding CsgD family transcriptional regulator